MSVLVIIEQTGAVVHPMSLEALAAGQSIAGDLGLPLVAAALGSGAGAAAREIAGHRLSEVLAVEGAGLEEYTPDGYSAALRLVIEQVGPRLVLFPHTYQVRDFGPKLATSMGKPFLSDAVGVRIEDSELVFVRQLFQGKLQADVVLEGEAPYFASVQSGTFRAEQLEAGESLASVRTIPVETGAIRTKPGERFRESKGEVDLGSAELIVSVGRGIGSPENIPLAEKLATALGAELAASRPICDSGWLPLERQVGSSGQSVSPKVYLALGISGAIQHVVGMKGSKTIVAVNKDESAPIFEIADYGIVGDLFEVVPAILEALEG